MNQKQIIFLIDDENDNQRLDKAITVLLKDFSRTTIKNWIQKGQVLVDNERAEPKHKVHKGQKIEVTPIIEDRHEATPEKIDFTVLFEDEDILIVEKPSGLVVHPGHGNPKGTLQYGLLYYLPDLKHLPRAGLIHRLDKNTSGLLIVAKTNRAYTTMVAELEQRNIMREYRAICVGAMTSGATIEASIARDPRNRIKFSTAENGKRAVTNYRILKKFDHHTYIGLRLETGRTHQIRVHMSHIKYPILGDSLYGNRLMIPSGASDYLKSALRQLKRQALHASKLTFVHPFTKEKVSIDSEIPEDMFTILSELSGSNLTREEVNSLEYPE